MPTRLRFALLLALSLAATTVLAGGPPSLVWRGDITTARFVEGMAKAWQRAGHPRMQVQPFNTISGIDAVVAGTADLAGSARGRAPRRPSETSLVFTPVAWDGLVIIVNARNPASNLSLKQLHDIYYGRIHNWKSLGGRDQAIHVYAVASPTDGIEFSLRRLLFGRGNQPVAAPRLYLTVAKLQRAVELDPQAIGVTTLSNALAQGKLKMLTIDHVEPSLSRIRNGSYPLYTPLYLVSRPTNAGNPKQKQVDAFLAYAQSPAVAGLLRRQHLLPYAQAPDLAGHDEQRIADIAKETGRRIYHHATNAATQDHR